MVPAPRVCRGAANLKFAYPPALCTGYVIKKWSLFWLAVLVPAFSLAESQCDRSSKRLGRLMFPLLISHSPYL